MAPFWITVFLDHPAVSHRRAVDFWCAVTGTTSSPPRGERDEFTTLLPSSGAAFCKAQATDDGRLGVHLDLHVTSITAARREAERLGAAVVADPGHVELRSPAGVIFCLVDHEPGSEVPSAVGNPPAALDQVAIDVPASAFDAEVDFWSALLGWPRLPPRRFPEFARLDQPPGLPVRMLFQRLGDGDATEASVHVDVGAGDGRETVAQRHQAWGATRVATFEHWIVLRDPVGREYCVTAQEP
jgi:predicted enzyme related to lactoylglutathione lyase